MERQPDPLPEPRAAAGQAHACGWDREASLCLAVLLLLALASLPWLAHGTFDPKNDACMYILLARGMLSGEGYSLLGEAFALRPPGFPALIAPLIAVFGTDFGILNLFVNLCGVACVALLFVIARPRLGARLALVVAAFLWVSPGFRTSCNQVMSEVPGIALALACLALGPALERRARAGLVQAFGLGVLVGAATLVRTVNVLLLPAFLLAGLLRRGSAPRSGSAPGGGLRGLLLVLGAAALLAPWSLRNAFTELPAPTEQTSVYSYGTGMFHADPGDPGSARLSWREVAGRVPDQLGQIAETLGSRFSDASGPFESTPGPASALGVLGLACVAIIALRRREPLELTCLALFAAVAGYFAFVDRLVLPVFVLGLPALAETCSLALGRVAGPARARLLVATGLILLAAADLRHLPAPGPLELREQRMRALASALDERLPPAAPLATRLGWELGVYLEQRRVYSLYVVAKRGERAGMLELLERRGIDHCVFHQPTRDDRTLRKALQGVFRKTDELDEWWLVERRP